MTSTEAPPLWVPDARRVAASAMRAFRALAEARAGRALGDYDALHAWSVEQPGAFWDAVWDFGGVIGDKGGAAFVSGLEFRKARFFPDAQLNFCENLLVGEGECDALVFCAEDRAAGRWSWNRLRATVSRIRQALQAEDVVAGDVVVACLPNIPEAVALMLAVTSIGAVWASVSPEFGVEGVLSRFGQLSPKLLIGCDGYWYNGKPVDTRAKMAEIAARLKVSRAVVMVPFLDLDADAAAAVPGARAFAAWHSGFAPEPIVYERFGFDHPLFVMFSSGTTGAPKCIVHRTGGVLLQLRKEHLLHCDIRPGDRVFYFSTLGWMMWNWLAAALASEAILLLYDGSPLAPEADTLFAFAARERATHFGTSAKYIDTLRKKETRPGRDHDLAALRAVLSTGSPLSPEGFRYVYKHIKADLHLASISGGTDIVSCFVLGDPTRPVRAGEIQGPGLGMAVEVWGEDGPLSVGKKGELVCTRPFPSMPLGFWNDADDSRMHAAYFDRFDDIWYHGDYAERTAHGGFVIHGRSDATLNPGGVRIGTAEIYAVVERLDEVEEAICVGQRWDGDVRVVLFVRLRDGAVLDAGLEQRIQQAIRSSASPRHVPAIILAVPEIPRTKSGKIVELAVRQVIHGEPVRNVEALANPQALDLFKDRPELAR